jgi:hypothetical protein
LRALFMRPRFLDLAWTWLRAGTVLWDGVFGTGRTGLDTSGH